MSIGLGNKKGFTLLECILTLCLFSIVLTSTVSLYLAGYRMYRRQEHRVEVEENIMAVLNRISETLRRTDGLPDNISVSDNMLIIGDTKYYYMSGNIYERIGFGTNNLGGNISLFEFSLEDDYLTLKIEGIGYLGEATSSAEQVFFIGGE